jgi:hypothetical protein
MINRVPLETVQKIGRWITSSIFFLLIKLLIILIDLDKAVPEFPPTLNAFFSLPHCVPLLFCVRGKVVAELSPEVKSVKEGANYVMV